MKIIKIEEAFNQDVIKMFDSPVVIPTETVYGLAARIDNEDSLSKIFEIKGRPKDNPLIVHISSYNMLNSLIKGNIPHEYKILMEKYWPGPLTLLFEAKENISNLIKGNGLNYIAIRMPASDKLRNLIDMIGVPLAAPSANTSGRPSPTTVQHVIDDLNDKVNLYIDDGPCDVGLESTVFGIIGSQPHLLRPGGITLEDLEKTLNCKINIKTKINGTESVICPGQKYRHYSPSVPVYLFKGQNVEEEMKNMYRKLNNKKIGVMCSSDFQTFFDYEQRYDLGTNLKDWSKRIFAGLRYLDGKCEAIFVEGVSTKEEGLAIMDRLEKAASYILE